MRKMGILHNVTNGNSIIIFMNNIRSLNINISNPIAINTVIKLNITYNRRYPEIFDLPVASHCPRIRGNLSGPHLDLFDLGLLDHMHTLNRNGLPDLWAHAWSAWFGNLACYILDFGRADLS